MMATETQPPRAKYNTVRYSAVQYVAVQHSTVRYSTVCCSAVQYSTVQYSRVKSLTKKVTVPVYGVDLNNNNSTSATFHTELVYAALY